MPSPPLRSGPGISWPLTTGILFAAAIVTNAVWPLITTDVGADYVPWLNHIVDTGPVAAFAAPFGAYTPPYLYLLALATPLHGLLPDPYIIKSISMLGHALLALSIWRLLTGFGVADAGRMALVSVALPSTLFNAALLGQCDAYYVAPLVMAVAMAVERRHLAMCAWGGLAVAVKAQAVLIGPFFLALLIERQVPLRLWLAAPLAFVAAMAPAWAAGWPLGDLLTIYFRQAETFSEISRNAPNVWMIVLVLGIAGAPFPALASGGAVAASAAFVVRGATILRQATPLIVLRAATLAPMLTAGLLPRMHERYFILADVLSLALAAAERTRVTIVIAAFVQLGSFAAVLAYVTGIPALAAFGALPMIVATVLLAHPFLSAARNAPSKSAPVGGEPPRFTRR